jgi:hypothetical protein
MLGVLKFSTMDPFGMGVEMEGGKPGALPALSAPCSFCVGVLGTFMLLVWLL